MNARPSFTRQTRPLLKCFGSRRASLCMDVGALSSPISRFVASPSPSIFITPRSLLQCASSPLSSRLRSFSSRSFRLRPQARVATRCGGFLETQLFDTG